ncbi:DUF4129 domain-containing protein [Flavisolibacter nicotianae]|uniref:DUF4129 domain-containing protein n=1 Tax=Flavisolibacter nicotianae TaxID=2364882 RepID=UPI000EAD95BF|nr:DUF4129 domain-containing protein [Flavisolibacter nicotianae]
MCKKASFVFAVFFLLLATMAGAQSATPIIDSIETSPLQVDDTASFSVVSQPQAVAARIVPKQQVDSLKAEDDFWYANTSPERKKLPPADRENRQRTLFQQAWFRDLLWVIILCSFVAVVLWYLYSSRIFLFRKKAKTLFREDGEDAVPDDIFALAYATEIANAENSANFRLAVRLRYLQTLNELAEKSRIEYQHGRTNSDYVRQLQSSPLYRDFFRLTRNFEYTWYGQFDLSEAAYEMMRNDFSSFQNRLRG